VTRYYDPARKSEANYDSVMGYREGVNRVLEYITSTHSYPKLTDELSWAIEEGII
jgi:hypothetical protein